ncbi:Uncharacterised protein [Escherichia coli]|uniref:Uncharacterized protein n=1 Tax=Escherichia coli TaxID=562 RepID=A0A376KHP3_ECOLX|nr:Uncharacterised protein [Escherichia coli]
MKKDGRSALTDWKIRQVNTSMRQHDALKKTRDNS